MNEIRGMVREMGPNGKRFDAQRHLAAEDNDTD